MKRYNTLVFDLDGTLLDTLGDLTDGVNHVLSRFNFEQRTQDEIRSFIGNGVPTLLRRALPVGVDDGIHTEALRLFGEFYMSNIKNSTLPYDGIQNMLRELSGNGYKIGVVSNKKDDAVKELCAYFFGDIFNGEKMRAVFGATGEHNRKPSPLLVLEAMRVLGSDKDETVFIGDSDVDIRCAENAGIDIICVGWGYRNADYLRSKGAKTVAADTNELLKLLTIGV